MFELLLRIHRNQPWRPLMNLSIKLFVISWHPSTEKIYFQTPPVALFTLSIKKSKQKANKSHQTRLAVSEAVYGKSIVFMMNMWRDVFVIAKKKWMAWHVHPCIYIPSLSFYCLSCHPLNTLTSRFFFSADALFGFEWTCVFFRWLTDDSHGSVNSQGHCLPFCSFLTPAFENNLHFYCYVWNISAMSILWWMNVDLCVQLMSSCVIFDLIVEQNFQGYDVGIGTFDTHRHDCQMISWQILRIFPGRMEFTLFISMTTTALLLKLANYF